MKIDYNDPPHSAEVRLAALAERVREWLAESALSERITAKRCRELLALCNEFSPNAAYCASCGKRRNSCSGC
jgi:hypothetical protein